MSLQVVRIDALPEHHDYRDEGCELSPSCLTCPLPRCKYESGGGAAIRRSQRDEVIRAMREEEGAPVNVIASTFGISRRSVSRVLEGQEAAAAPVPPLHITPAASRAVRLLRLARELESSRWSSAGQLAAALAVSTRTVQRDIGALKALQFPVVLVGKRYRMAPA